MSTVLERNLERARARNRRELVDQLRALLTKWQRRTEYAGIPPQDVLEDLQAAGENVRMLTSLIEQVEDESSW